MPRHPDEQDVSEATADLQVPSLHLPHLVHHRRFDTPGGPGSHVHHHPLAPPPGGYGFPAAFSHLAAAPVDTDSPATPGGPAGHMHHYPTTPGRIPGADEPVNEYALDAEHDPSHPDHAELMALTNTPGRSRRRRVIKDPNAPRFYTSAFQLFWKEKSEYLSELHKQSPLSLMDRNLIIKKFYDDLTPQERQKYRDAANADRERYLAEFAEYMKTPEYAKYQLVARAEAARLAATPPKPRKISAAAAQAHAEALARKKKDGRPKALTAFFLFCNEMRDKVVLSEDTGENKLLAQTKVLTDMWRAMDESQKQRYRDMYQQQRAAVLTYQQEHAAPPSRSRLEQHAAPYETAPRRAHPQPFEPLHHHAAAEGAYPPYLLGSVDASTLAPLPFPDRLAAHHGMALSLGHAMHHLQPPSPAGSPHGPVTPPQQQPTPPPPQQQQQHHMVSQQAEGPEHPMDDQEADDDVVVEEEDTNVQALLHLDAMNQMEELNQLDEMNQIAEALVNEAS